jgi:hypothetical protein
MISADIETIGDTLQSLCVTVYGGGENAAGRRKFRRSKLFSGTRVSTEGAERWPGHVFRAAEVAVLALELLASDERYRQSRKTMIAKSSKWDEKNVSDNAEILTDALGRRLKSAYLHFLNEPIPDRFIKLLEKLDETSLARQADENTSEAAEKKSGQE